MYFEVDSWYNTLGTVIQVSRGNFYSERMSTRFNKILYRGLRKRVDGLLNVKSDLVDIRILEFALHEEAVEAYGQAVGTGNADLISASLTYMDERSDRAQKVVLNEARIQQDGQVSIHAVTFAVEAAMKAMGEQLNRFDNIIDGPPSMIMDAVRVKVQETLQITDESVGTSLTPDMDAKEMDATVPYFDRSLTNGKTA